MLSQEKIKKILLFSCMRVDTTESASQHPTAHKNTTAYKTKDLSLTAQLNTCVRVEALLVSLARPAVLFSHALLVGVMLNSHTIRTVVLALAHRDVNIRVLKSNREVRGRGDSPGVERAMHTPVFGRIDLQGEPHRSS